MEALVVETIRLLLYVAWVDDEIAPEEYDYLLRMARNSGMPEDDILSLDRALRDASTLRRPDMSILRQHRDEVLAHVRALIEADDHIADSEIDILHRIAAALSD